MMKIRRRTVLRYLLYQTPGWALLLLILIGMGRWTDLPSWVIWVVLALWLAKDAILFPFVWRAYDRDRLEGLHSLVGFEGIVEERLAPSGYIRVHGELWQAEIVDKGRPLEKGETVRIEAVRGLTLLVQPKERRDLNSAKEGG
jgi:membrane protein implicated in regulation of membrane protease activity